MLRKLLILLACGTAIGAVAAPGASAEPVFAADIIIKHHVVWDYQTAGYPDDCKSWSKGSGTQTISVNSLKREKLRLDSELGKTFLSGMGIGGTFEGSVDRVGKWENNVPKRVPQCVPCGPGTIYGECEDPKPPEPLQLKCGHEDLVRPKAVVSYGGFSVPSLSALQVGYVVTPQKKLFPECPPDLPRGAGSGTSLHNVWPGYGKLPADDTKRIARLGVGDSVTADVRVQKSYVRNMGKVTEGTKCSSAPDLTDGYSECAITDFSVTFTRLR